jgi:hypothetical protein
MVGQLLDDWQSVLSTAHSWAVEDTAVNERVQKRQTIFLSMGRLTNV